MNPKILAQKEQAVKDLEAKSKDSNAIVVVEYRGLSVTKIQALRKLLRESDASIGVYKNSIFRRAVASISDEAFNEALVGPNAIVFGKDIIELPKALFKFARRNDKLNIKAGIVEGRTLNVDQLKELSKLPGKNGLISMFLSCLLAPVSQLARTLDAVRAQKEAK